MDNSTEIGQDVFEFNFDHISQSELDECKKAYEEGGVEGCRQYFKDKQDEWKTIPLNIAVIGNSGVGKSSFINAIRDLTADDEGAAEVDVVEATMDITPYSHPENEMLKFWDLPGVGTDRFPKDLYLETIKVDRYDFFLLLTASRFTENDTWLGNEIVNRRKGFYFVRTKIGADVASDRKAHPRSHNEQAVLQKIRDNIDEHLAASKSKCREVFLIDSYKKNRFDFVRLEESIIDDFPELKRSAMILSMGAFSEKMIKLKAKELRLKILGAAALSAAVGAVPVPGVSLAFDATMTITLATVFYHQLGLDDKSLEKHAALTHSDPEELKRLVTSRKFGKEFFTVQSVKMVFQAAMGAASIAAMVVEEFLHWVPVIGSIVAAPLSFAGTYFLLKVIIDKMESVALEVVRCAAEHSQVDSDADDD